MGAWLLAPAGDEAYACAAQTLVFDVASAARGLAAARSRGVRKLYVRVSPLDSGAIETDLDAVMSAAPDGLVLPACRNGADVQRLGVKLAVREAVYGLADGSTEIVAIAGADALSLLGLSSYVGCSRRLRALAWDRDALAADLGARRRDASPLGLARDLLLIAARAAGVAALDTAAEGDAANLRAEAERAREDGFAGKFARTTAEAAVIAEVWAAGSSGNA